MTTVLVAGAGPTGLALAAQLHAFGVAVRIVDQRVDHQPSRAFVVQPRTLEVLAPVGITAPLVARGNRSARLALHAGRRRASVAMAMAPTAGVRSAFPFLLAIPQADVEAVLADHLVQQGLTVEWGVRLSRLEAADHTVSCHLEHGDGRTEHVRVPWVVGCDGRDSVVRTQAGIGFPGRCYRQQLLLADVELHTDLEREVVHGLLGPGGAVFLFPFPHSHRWRLLCALDAAGGARDLAAVATTALDAVSGGRARVTAVEWAAPVELRRAQAETYRRGRILLAGDAAHVHSPAGAQGMNTGLQDAVNLGWKLALAADPATAGPASARLLDTFESERWPVARWTRRLTDVAFFFEVGDVGPLGWLRTHVGPALAPVMDGRSMPGWMFGLVGGLLTGYRPGPAAEEGRPRLRGRARAGRRMPDGELVVDGRPQPVHDLLGRPGFHLFQFADAGSVGPPDPIGPVPVHPHRVDRAATASQPGGAALLGLLGVHGPAVYLVRPDGYVGYRAAGADLAGVHRHLRRLAGI